MTSYDAKNAFHSIYEGELTGMIRKYARLEDCQLLEQRVQAAVVTVPTPKGEIDFKTQQGALPGDSIAAQMFRVTYADVVDGWMEVTGGEEEEIVAIEPASGQRIVLNTSVYADDICRTTPQMQAIDIPARLECHDSELTVRLAAIGIAQSAQKKRAHMEALWDLR
jgi:hypothetical protein